MCYSVDFNWFLIIFLYCAVCMFNVWHCHGVHEVLTHLFLSRRYNGYIDLYSSAGLNIVCSYAQIVQLKFRNVQSKWRNVQLTVNR